jgi:hypothetical protein
LLMLAAMNRPSRLSGRLSNLKQHQKRKRY